MASLWRSLKNWFRGQKDAAAEALADPVRDGKFDIEDSEKQVEEFKSKIARFMAINKTRQSELKESEQAVIKWANIAEQAAGAGNRDDVESALNNKHAAENKVKAFIAEITKNEQVITVLRKQLNSARMKIANAKSQHAQLSARMEGAKIRKEMINASLGDGPLARLDNLQNSVRDAENEAESLEELENSDTKNLTEKYNTTSADIKSEADELMARMTNKSL